MTHIEAFQILRKFSKRIDIDSSSKFGGNGVGDRVQVEWTVCLWLACGDFKLYEGEELHIAVGRAVADLTSPGATTLECLDASLKTVIEKTK